MYLTHLLLASRPVRLALVVGALSPLALSGCGDDRADARPRTYVVDGVDFAFEGLPDTIAAGSRLELTNQSPTELHELVAFRLLDDESRSIDDLVHHDPEALFAAGPPALVVLTPPDGEPFVAVGDGTLTEPGRYAIVCMIPTGVDPAEYLEALATSGDGPPKIPGADAPHLAHGMYTEVTVTG